MSTAKAERTIVTRDTIQKLACEAINAWRDHILVLIDALEETNSPDAKFLRQDIGQRIYALPVDHQATRNRTMNLEFVARRLFGIARPRFYLSKMGNAKTPTLKVWTRGEQGRRKCVATVHPSERDGKWQPLDVSFKLYDGADDDRGERINLHLDALLVEGCMTGKRPDEMEQGL